MQDFARGVGQREGGAGFRGEAEGGRCRISSSHKGRTVDERTEFIFAGRGFIFAGLVSFQMKVSFRFR